MPDTLGELCKRAIERRGGREPTEWSEISVEPMDFAGKDAKFVGVAIIDGRSRSDLHKGRSTTFRVESGEHTVSVHVRRSLRAGGYLGRATATLLVIVEPGESLDLVCGVSKVCQPPPLWYVFSLLLLLEASYGLAFGIDWLAYPVLREAVAWTTLTFGTRQPWLSWFYSIVSRRTMAATFVMFAWIVIAHKCLVKRFVGRSRQLESPYFLVEKRDLRKPSPALKEQYTELFE